MFRHPVYFVHHDLDKWSDVIAREEPPPAADYGLRLREGNDNWVLQTYLELKRRGLNVHIVGRPVVDAVCVAHYDDILLKEMPLSSFLVGVRGDRPDIHVAAMTVVQNRTGMRPGRDFFMPHWSQPGLVARDAARGANLETAGYLGMKFNLHPAFLSPEFDRGLARLGMRLVIREYPFQDFADVDVVLAVRPGTVYDINLKPATKLQNAWLAGCPAILGVESAYRQYRQSELDYFEASSPGEALEAIERLKNDPGLYEAMARNGRTRGAEFTHDRIAQLWAAFLEGPVTDAYERWLDARRYWRWFDCATFPVYAAQHKLGRYRHLRRIRAHG